VTGPWAIRPRPLDWAAVAATVLAAALFSWRAYSGEAAEPMLYIQNEAHSWVYPLDREGIFPIPGPLGTTTVVLRNGAALVEDSPCRDKLCVSMGSISRRGDWAACLPNRVFLRIDRRERGGEGIDASAY